MRLFNTVNYINNKTKNVFSNNNTYSLFISQSLIKNKLTVNTIQTNMNIIN